MPEIIKELFPQEFIDLAREVRNHPQLQINLNEDFQVSLSKIAAYCNVALDGVYTYDDQKQIASRLTEILFKARYSQIN